jgi:hypothetical protein
MNEQPEPREEWDLAAVAQAEQIEPKPWYLSRSLIGVLVVAAAQLARLAGWDVDTQALTDALVDLITLIGLVLAYVGRVKATRPISRKQVLPGVRLPGPDVDIVKLRKPVPSETEHSAERNEGHRSGADEARDTWLGH